MDRQTCLARPVPSPPSRTRTPWIAATGAELRTPFLYFPSTHWVFGACLLLLASLQMIAWKEAGNRLIQRDKCWENHTPITPFNNNRGEAEEESREQHRRSGENLRVCPRHLKPSAESQPAMRSSPQVTCWQTCRCLRCHESDFIPFQSLSLFKKPR